MDYAPRGRAELKPYAELLEINQPNPIRIPGFTRIRDQFPELQAERLHAVVIDDRTKPIYRFNDTERISEFSGRWDYGSKNASKLGQTANDGTPIIKKWIAAGEQSMLEMAHATVFFECSRVSTHELVRHRLASYQQESQRFTLQVLDEDSFYVPQGLDPLIEEAMRDQYLAAARVYGNLLDAGVPKQLARYVLPNATSTRIIVSANLREWRHIFKLRLDKSAQPEMREMMQMAYDQMLPVFPQSLEGVLEGERGIR